MANLEKMIRYDQAVMEEGLIQSDTTIKMAGVNNLYLLCHFETANQSSFDLHYGDKYGVISGGGLISQAPFLGKNLYMSANKSPNCLAPYDLDLGGINQLSIAFAVKVDVQWDGSFKNLLKRSSKFIIGNNTTNLFATAYDSSGTAVTIVTSGLGLTWDTWYWVNFVISPEHIYLYCNNVLVADSVIDGILEDWGIVDFIHILESRLRTTYIDELIIRKEAVQILKPTSPFKPYSQDLPKAEVSLDAGFDNALWLPNELGFLDETDFNNEGIKIRVDADNDNTADFSGDLLSLEQTRNLGTRSGKYLHLEFSFISDGNAQRILYPGKVGLKSQCLIQPRREPELIPRF